MPPSELGNPWTSPNIAGIFESALLRLIYVFFAEVSTQFCQEIVWLKLDGSCCTEASRSGVVQGPLDAGTTASHVCALHLSASQAVRATDLVLLHKHCHTPIRHTQSSRPSRLAPFICPTHTHTHTHTPTPTPTLMPTPAPTPMPTLTHTPTHTHTHTHTRTHTRTHIGLGLGLGLGFSQPVSRSISQSAGR